AYIIEAILQKTFTKEELQHKDNIIFGIIVILMFLDSSYNQAEISALKSNNSNEYYENMDSDNNNKESDNSSNDNEDNFLIS
ncbi:329_t:CDS:2, partial [Funneliformis geosporum]